MNPDSYANLLMVYRLRDKQYESYLDVDKDPNNIFLKYKKDWNEGPDWDTPGQMTKRLPRNI